jgi:hypothetical protein
LGDVEMEQRLLIEFDVGEGIVFLMFFRIGLEFNESAGIGPCVMIE